MTGQLVEIDGRRQIADGGTAEDTLRFTYDGSLPTSVTWSGPVNGNVSVTYNNDFKVTSQSVNGGNTVSYAYDNDGP